MGFGLMEPRALALATDIYVLLVRSEFAAGSSLLSPGCAISGNTSSLTLQSGVQLGKRFVLLANGSVEAEG